MAWLGRILEGNFSVSNRGPRGTASNMRGNYLIGFAAGIVTAVVFLSATTGSVPMRVLLFLLTPLPLFLAGFGWGWGTTVIAAIAGTLATAVLTTVQVATIFAISPAIPSIILTYLVTLNRPATGPGPDVDPNTRLEWYPVGRIVVWAAAISGVMALIAMVLIGPDLDTLRQEVKKLVETVFKAQFESINGGKALSDADLERLVDVGMYILPAATALSWMLTVLLNLWLAGRIALASGRLPRPWPDIPQCAFRASRHSFLQLPVWQRSSLAMWLLVRQHFQARFILRMCSWALLSSTTSRAASRGGRLRCGRFMWCCWF